MTGGLKPALVGTVGGTVLDGLLATVRFEATGEEHWRGAGPVLFALWHGRLLPLTYYHRGQGIVTLVSASRDGEYIARVMRRWGYGVSRGSSSRRGGAGLRELVRQARAGRSLAITPDGPRGPRQRLKPGVLLAAQLTGLPIVPMSAAANRAWWFEGWDRFLVPRPFARLNVAYAAPVTVPRDADADRLEAIGREVERTLDRLTREVDDAAAG